MWTECLKMIITGFSAGAGPCLLSCAPVLLPLLATADNEKAQGIKATLLFVTGRIIAYLVLGFMAGWSIRWLELFHNSGPVSAVVKNCAAGFIIMLGLLIIIGRGISYPCCNRFIKYFIDKNHKSMFILGILLGFAPCFPLIGILTYIAVKATSPWQGLLYAGCFGLGNMIIVLILGGFSATLLARFRQGVGRGQSLLTKASGIFLILWGILLIFNN